MNFDFKINDDTQVYQSCSSVLNGELFVFGGSTTSNNKIKQVTFISSIYAAIKRLYLGLESYWLRTETNWRFEL